MEDIEIILENRPGQLALMGEILGNHQISLEGGGAFANGSYVLAHFLVVDAQKAKTVLEGSGFLVKGIHGVIVQKLRQDVPGQLGKFCKKLADAQVNILAQYSDHTNQLILVVDDRDKAGEISRQWMQQWWGHEDPAL